MALRLRSDLRRLPLVDGGVAAIWCSAALLHIDRSDLDATFAEWNRVLIQGGVVGFATSLGSDEGWELVPAGVERRPEIVEGHERWFVHHEQEALEVAVDGAGWSVAWSAIRSSHRDWLQVLATKSG